MTIEIPMVYFTGLEKKNTRMHVSKKSIDGQNKEQEHCWRHYNIRSQITLQSSWVETA